MVNEEQDDVELDDDDRCYVESDAPIQPTTNGHNLKNDTGNQFTVCFVATTRLNLIK